MHSAYTHMRAQGLRSALRSDLVSGADFELNLTPPGRLQSLECVCRAWAGLCLAGETMRDMEESVDALAQVLRVGRHSLCYIMPRTSPAPANSVVGSVIAVGVASCRRACATFLCTSLA